MSQESMALYDRCGAELLRNITQRPAPLMSDRFAGAVAFSICRTKPMLLFTQAAKGGRCKVVDLVPDGFHRFQKRIYRFQIIVGHLAEKVPGHRGVQRSRTNLAISQRLNESRFVVITNSG